MPRSRSEREARLSTDLCGSPSLRGTSPTGKLFLRQEPEANGRNGNGASHGGALGQILVGARVITAETLGEALTH